MILNNSEPCLNLVRKIQDQMRKGHKTLATAESCTGGLLASLLTHFPGSSQFYLGGVSAYSNEAKEKILGVPAEIIKTHGAVSEACALAMAEGARKTFNSDYAISVTGIAGPAGGSDEKPVGTIYVGLTSSRGSSCLPLQLGEKRLENRSEVCHIALSELLSTL